MNIKESGETYLETILLLEKRNAYVRSVDIAHELNYSKPSVSRAVGILKKENYIVVDKDGKIILTAEGRKRAEAIYERHCLISSYLVLTLGIDKTLADQDACRIEHIISEEVFLGIKKYVGQSQDISFLKE